MESDNKGCYSLKSFKHAAVALPFPSPYNFPKCTPQEVHWLLSLQTNQPMQEDSCGVNNMIHHATQQPSESH